MNRTDELQETELTVIDGKARFKVHGPTELQIWHDGDGKTVIETGLDSSLEFSRRSEMHQQKISYMLKSELFPIFVSVELPDGAKHSVFRTFSRMDVEDLNVR